MSEPLMLSARIRMALFIIYRQNIMFLNNKSQFVAKLLHKACVSY